MDSGFFLTLQALRRQLAAMPCDFYLIRLIQRHTRKALPGDRVWTAPQVLFGRTVSFLRARNREGYDVYFQPYAFQRNAGYILVDLDRADPAALDTMRANGHQPCVVIETSPGHLQAWIQVSSQPLEPAAATDIGRQLARLYQGDRASTD
jgi:DNA primase RepB-like protein